MAHNLEQRRRVGVQRVEFAKRAEKYFLKYFAKRIFAETLLSEILQRNLKYFAERVEKSQIFNSE